MSKKNTYPKISRKSIELTSDEQKTLEDPKIKATQQRAHRQTKAAQETLEDMRPFVDGKELEQLQKHVNQKQRILYSKTGFQTVDGKAAKLSHEPFDKKELSDIYSGYVRRNLGSNQGAELSAKQKNIYTALQQLYKEQKGGYSL